uniref:Uncharacterized protein n=1 Tax=Molossus molossus TaxID=27622 RepID=A0A7J8IZD0_MOLMO|nr:hypothetical protein HJG59_010380 [Molossus molossus]
MKADTSWRSPWDHGSRDWRDVVTAKGTWMTGSHQKLERGENEFFRHRHPGPAPLGSTDLTLIRPSFVSSCPPASLSAYFPSYPHTLQLFRPRAWLKDPCVAWGIKGKRYLWVTEGVTGNTLG